MGQDVVCSCELSPGGKHHGPLDQVSEIRVLSLAPPPSSCGTLARLAALFLTSVKTLALVILRVRYVKTLYKIESPMKYRIFLSLFFLITSSQQKHGHKTTWVSILPLLQNQKFS